MIIWGGAPLLSFKQSLVQDVQNPKSRMSPQRGRDLQHGATSQAIDNQDIKNLSISIKQDLPNTPNNIVAVKIWVKVGDDTINFHLQQRSKEGTRTDNSA